MELRDAESRAGGEEGRARLRGRVVALFADDPGPASALAEALESAGAQPHLMPLDAGESAVRMLGHLSREAGGPGAVIFLQADAGRDGGGLKTMFHGLKAVAAARPDVVLVTRQGSGPERHTAPLRGFLRALRGEWLDCGFRMLDFDPAGDWAGDARRVVEEWPPGEDWLEVVFRGGRRGTWRPVASVLPPDPGPAPLREGAVIVATGGLRGITAQAALGLARACGGRVHALGRTLPEDGMEGLDGGGDIQELRRRLLEQNRLLGRNETPASLERQIAGILKQRALRRTVRAYAAAGVPLACHQADVSDAGALGRALRRIGDEEGRIDAVLHGAGVIEDRLLVQKTEESFDRVYRTKVAAALALEQHLPRQHLQLVALFSSVSAYVGNRGQTDYAAANAALNALAAEWASSWGCRVVALAWGGWEPEEDAPGMVSSAVEERLKRLGVELIGREVGMRAFLDEVASPGPAHVLLGGGRWEEFLRAGSPARAVSLAGSETGGGA